MNRNTNSPTSGTRIAVRFGDAILQAGHTAVPNLALNHYAQLGVSHAEMMFTIHIWQYWWTAQDPYPALGTIAKKMGVSRRQARNYASGLKRKGFLEVQERYVAGLGQITSEYNFEPLIAAIVDLTTATDQHPRKDRSGEGWKDLSATPGKPASLEKDPQQEDISSNSSKANAMDSIRAKSSRSSGPQPVRRSARTSAGTIESASSILQRQAARNLKRGTPPDDAESTIAAHLVELRQEFIDQATASATTRRALNLFKRANVNLATFIGKLYEARSLTRDRSHGSGTPNRPMAYFFAVLEQSLGLISPGDQQPKR